jgi:hypothetical protein
VPPATHAGASPRSSAGTSRPPRTRRAEGRVAVVSVLVASGPTLLATRLAARALAPTGLSRASADVQARSALTGTGFTTREAEAVVSHPVRRRIVLHLMLPGGIGIVSVLASVVVTFLQPTQPRAWPLRLLVRSGGIATIWALTAGPWTDPSARPT